MTKTKLYKLNMIIVKVTVLLLIFFAGVNVGLELMTQKYNKEYANGVVTYFFKSPVIVDPLVNVISDIYVTGELKRGTCFEK